MYTIHKGSALAVISKSGSQSITMAANGWYVSNEQALLYPRRIFFIREPFERLKSGYSFFKLLKLEGSKYNNRVPDFVESWNAFIDYVLDTDHQDEHFLPQTYSLFFSGALTANVILRFEDINEWWPLFFTSKLERLNSAHRVSEINTDYRKREIDEYYALDSATYATAERYIQGGKIWP